MAGPNLASAWSGLDDPTKIRLSVNELDRIYGRLDELARQTATEHTSARSEFVSAITAARKDFHERITALRSDVEDHVTTLRTEMRDGFEKVERRQNRSIGLLYTMIGGIVVGLALLVVQLAPH